MEGQELVLKSGSRLYPLRRATSLLWHSAPPGLGYMFLRNSAGFSILSLLSAQLSS